MSSVLLVDAELELASLRLDEAELKKGPMDDRFEGDGDGGNSRKGSPPLSPPRIIQLRRRGLYLGGSRNGTENKFNEKKIETKKTT